MENTYWQKQTVDKPLFPDMLWSRPENRATAGKLLIVGGNLHGFAAPAEAYAEATKAGVGTAKVILPDATKSLLSHVQGTSLYIEYAPSTPSGSFSQKALAELMDHSNWADGVLLAGELGRNSETAILLEQFAAKYSGLLTITRDAVDYFKASPLQILNRPQTAIVLSLAQLQKLFVNAQFTQPITLGMDVLKLVQTLHDITQQHPSNIITKHHTQILVACQGQVSATKLNLDMPIWRVKTAAHAATWWLQNTSKKFQALTAAISTLHNNN